MKWSWKLGEVAGIGVYVHATFALLIAWVGLSYWLEGGTLSAALEGVGFVLALFVCVTLHELGHALMARRYGVRTRDITLLPIGGVARLERIPQQPIQELWVALAGLAVSVGIAALLLGGLRLTGNLQPLDQLGVSQGSFLQRLALVNLFLAAFNSIPAFPMDGGRVLRALLAMRMDYASATEVAARLGQGFAFLLAFLGLFVNPFLVFIALFVWMGAAQEAGTAQVRAAMAGIPVSRGMLTEFHTLRPDDPLSRAVDLLLSGSQQDFPVVDGGQVVGMLTRRDLVAALAQREQSTPVAEVMQRDVAIVDSSDPLESACRRFEEGAYRAVVVVHDGELVGLLTLENVGELLMIQSALGGPAHQPHAA